MADRLLTALIIAAAVVLTALAIHALTRYNRRLDGKPDTGQAAGSPGQVKVSILVKDEMSAALANVLASLPAPAARCGAHGPGGMRCDREPHDPFDRHEQDGIGWRGATRPPAHGWWLR